MSQQYRMTATGRPTVVGTRNCSECGRKEFETKKQNSDGSPVLNERYTLCKGVCVYCYNTKRTKSNGTSLSEDQLKAKIAYYTDMLQKHNQEQK